MRAFRGYFINKGLLYLTIFTLGNVKGILVVYFMCKQYDTNAFFGFVNLVSLRTFSQQKSYVSNYNDEIYLQNKSIKIPEKICV